MQFVGRVGSNSCELIFLKPDELHVKCGWRAPVFQTTAISFLLAG